MPGRRRRCSRARSSALPDAEDFQVGRVTFEILRPVPIGAGRGQRPRRCARAGGCSWSRRSCATASELADAGHRLAAAHGRRSSCPRARWPAAGRRPGPSRAAKPISSRPARSTATTRRWRLASSPAGSWSRARRSPGCGCASRWSPARSPRRCSGSLVAADVGNGISAALDYRQFLFLNVELTVHLERMPAGEWICVDAATLPQPSGVGDRRVGPL